MEKTYDPQSIQDKFQQHWAHKQSFTTSLESSTSEVTSPYCIMLPPPNVTGSLHMGHAFQHTIMDILIRSHKMRGEHVLWQAGTDHAGIATQMVVERMLAKEGISRHDLGREQFLEKVWQWKAQSGGTITSQMKELGTAIDWSRERFTMDEGLSEAVTKVFVELYNKGQIYRGKRLVNWDPVLGTAVSDLEVIATPEMGKMYYVRYPFTDGSGYMHIATTRPETILADGALAVNPEDERFTQYIGKYVHVPLTDRTIPVIADEYVDSAFGTGCVKITPAHDFNDWEVGMRHEMEVINLMTPDAKMNENCPDAYTGLDRFDAREQIIKDLEAAELLEKIEPHELKRPRGDRTGAVIEPYLTDQWFVDTSEMAKKARKVVEDKEIRFIPENWEKTYFNWLDNIEDWCISRQIWWGHRIPAYFDNEGNIYVAQSLEAAREQAGGVELTQDEDVLDTWFSSALWPFSTLGWPEENDYFKTFYPTSVLVTGFDIIFFWVARMVMFGLEFTGKIPFKEIYMTGLVRDSHGDKMSKSKGNVLDPLDIINGITLKALLEKRTTGMMQPELAEKIKKQTKAEFPQGIKALGADALRFNFAATASFGRDIKFDLDRVEGYRNFCNKLWNASRFVFSNITDLSTYSEHTNTPTTFDNWIISRLERVKTQVHEYREAYRFDLMSKELYEFVWHDYCDWYLEFSKATIDNSTTGYTLMRVLKEILQLLHPIIPYITEEIYTTFNTGELLSDTTYVPANQAAIDTQAETDVAFIQECILGIRKIRADMNIAPNKALMTYTQHAPEVVATYAHVIMKVAKLSGIAPLADTTAEYATAVVENTIISIPLAGLVDVEAEINRLNKEIEKLEQQIAISNNKLANEKFVTHAKPEVVATERERLLMHTEKQGELITQRKKIKAL